MKTFKYMMGFIGGIISLAGPVMADVLIEPTSLTDFNANFRSTLSSGNNLAYNSNGYMTVDALSSGSARNLVYDTTPSNSSDSLPTLTGTVTISLQISAKQANSGFGIFLFDSTVGGPSSYTSGVLVSFVIDNSGTNDRISFYNGINTATAGAGTQITTGITTTGTLTSGFAYGASGLDVSPEASPVFGTLTLWYDPTAKTVTMSLGSFSATLSDVTISNLDFALRLVDADTTSGTTVKFSDISIVPEPSTYALLTLGLLGGLFIKRRKALS